MLPLDKWAMTKLNALIEKCEKAYVGYEFNAVTHAINDFCVVEMSNFYLDIIKDRLYCDERNGLSRRSAQTAMYLILDTITKIMAPILAFTCDEIWQAMAHAESDDSRNVLFNEMNKPFEGYVLSEEEMALWETLAALRSDVNAALEAARSEKLIGKSLEAQVKLSALNEEGAALLKELESLNLAELFIVSKVSVGEGASTAGANIPGIAVAVSEAPGTKCPRCWAHSEEANEDGLCPRCAAVVAKMEE